MVKPLYFEPLYSGQLSIADTFSENQRCPLLRDFTVWNLFTLTFGLVSAIADIEIKSHHDTWLALKSNVHGFRMENDDFIFYADKLVEGIDYDDDTRDRDGFNEGEIILDDDIYRKLVRTTNLGAFVKDGILPLPGKGWENSDNWMTAEDSYKVVNFDGTIGKAYLDHLLLKGEPTMSHPTDFHYDCLRRLS